MSQIDEISMWFELIRENSRYNSDIRMGSRAAAILMEALCHSIQHQKFVYFHVNKRKITDQEWLSYPELINALCERDLQFKQTIQLYKSVRIAFNFPDLANIENEMYLWRRPRSKKVNQS